MVGACTHPSIYSFIHPSIHPSFHLSIHPSIHTHTTPLPTSFTHTPPHRPITHLLHVLPRLPVPALEGQPLPGPIPPHPPRVWDEEAQAEEEEGGQQQEEAEAARAGRSEGEGEGCGWCGVVWVEMGRACEKPG